MYRVRNNRVGIFISKVKKYRRSRSTTSSASLSCSSNISIESVPYSESLSYDTPFMQSIGVKVPATIQAATSGTVRHRCSRNRRVKSIKLHRFKCYQDRRVALSDNSIISFPRNRYHCLFDEENPIVAYFSDATLYSIPEHGAGLCHAKYSTIYPCREPDVWSVVQSNDRPHHRRSYYV